MVTPIQLIPAENSENIQVDSDLEITYDNTVTEGAGDLVISERDSLNVGSADFIGKIGEIVITKGELTLEDRQKLEGYLAWEWFAANNPLPDSHPYKYQRPVI